MTGRNKEELNGVTLLGSQKNKYPSDYAPEMLETFPNKHPDNDYFVKFNCPEFTKKREIPVRQRENRTFDRKNAVLSKIVDKYAGKSRDIRLRGRAEYVKIRCNP